MGQASKCNITIIFNLGVEIPLNLTSKTALQQGMLKYYYKSNPDAVGEPDITISEFDIYERAIELELYSSRRVNLDFQVDLLEDFLLQFNNIIEEVTQDKWVQV